MDWTWEQAFRKEKFSSESRVLWLTSYTKRSKSRVKSESRINGKTHVESAGPRVELPLSSRTLASRRRQFVVHNLKSESRASTESENLLVFGKSGESPPMRIRDCHCRQSVTRHVGYEKRAATRFFCRVMSLTKCARTSWQTKKIGHGSANNVGRSHFRGSISQWIGVFPEGTDQLSGHLINFRTTPPIFWSEFKINFLFLTLQGRLFRALFPRKHCEKVFGPKGNKVGKEESDWPIGIFRVSLQDRPRFSASSRHEQTILL